MITITDNALFYLSDSLKKNECDLIVYVSVVYPLTKYSHVNITFCKIDDVDINDIKINFGFDLYINNESVSFLKDSIIDYKDSKLLINAPNINKNNSFLKSDLRDNIKNLFENEINVILSQHGGFVELVDIINDKIAVIKFHGGCQGCGMVGYTLSSYIEKTIIKNFPQIEKISDITSHEMKDNAYY